MTARGILGVSRWHVGITHPSSCGRPAPAQIWSAGHDDELNEREVLTPLRSGVLGRYVCTIRRPTFVTPQLPGTCISALPTGSGPVPSASMPPAASGPWPGQSLWRGGGILGAVQNRSILDTTGYAQRHATVNPVRKGWHSHIEEPERRMIGS